MNDKEHLQNLFQQYLQGQCQPEEIDQILEYFGAEKQSEALKELIAQHLTNEKAFDNYTQQAIQQVLSKADQSMQAFVQERMVSKTGRNSRRIRWVLSGAAAAVLIALSIGIYTYSSRVPETQADRLAEASEIRAIGNSATLTLADGSVIALSEDQSGIVIGEDAIKYADNSLVISTEAEKSTHSEDNRNAKQLTLSTPRGAQYQVTLPDGSKVWLNAASKLSYPERFTGIERRVELEGEAYFEVNGKKGDSRKSVPFLVKTVSQEVEVLGTQFNVSAYSDELDVKTTLVEGSVKLLNNKNGVSLSLLPGEQGVLSNGKLVKSEVDVSRFVSWKDGLFSFDGKSFDQVMRELGRWYDLEIIYEGSIPQKSFYGEAFRSSKLSIVMKLLKSADVDYQLEGKKLIIRNKGKEEARI